MATAIDKYEALVKRFEDNENIVADQMFGKPCLKVHGKAFVSQHKETVVFKLSGALLAKAMGLPGGVLWDPSGKGRPMKEWVALTVAQCKHFDTLADSALAYVGEGA